MKKISVTKLIALIFLCGAFAFGTTAFALNVSAEGKAASSITIEIDYGDYDGNNLPNGKTGKSYPVFSCTATDDLGNRIGDVRTIVKSPDGRIVPQNGGRFETATEGEYSVEYVAVSGIISEVKTITVTVKAYTDTLTYDADGENVPETAETGYMVKADFGNFSGGVGDLTYKTVLRFGETDVGYSLTENGIYFVPEKAGVYTVSYAVCDFVCDEKSVVKTIIVTDGRKPVMQKPSLPLSAISGETIDLPLTDGVFYKDGAKYYLPVRVYYDGEEVGSDMRISDLQAGKHYVKYECVSPLDQSEKTEYTFELTVKNAKTGGERIFDNYFDFINCEPYTGSKREYMVRVEPTDSASFAFSREIPVDYLNFDISSTSSASSYSGLYLVLTDSENASDSVKIRIKRLSSYKNLSMSYDDKARSIINADDGALLAEIKSYSDGRAFEGFRSGKAYISFELEGVKKQTDFALNKIASNVITTDSFDYASPVFFANNDYRAVYVSYIGHSVYLPELKAFDLFDKEVEVTLTIYGETGIVYEGKGGYNLNITKSGEYMAEYVARDSYNNRKTQISTIYVGDMISPVINVSDIKANVKVGEELVLPKAKITDNDTDAADIVSYVYVVKGNYNKKLIGETYRFTEAGEYKIRYTAYDKNQNYTVVEFTVYCK